MNGTELELISGNQLDHTRLLAKDQGVGLEIYRQAIDGGDLAEFLKGLKAKYDPSGLWRLTDDDIQISLPALPKPTLADIKAHWSGIQKINFDSSPTDAFELSLGTLLRKDEEVIRGTEYERRRKGLTGLIGLQHAIWLVEHQDEHPAFKALLGKVYIDCAGIELLDSVGYRCFPRLLGGGGRFVVRLGWAGGGLRRYGRLGRSRT